MRVLVIRCMITHFRESRGGGKKKHYLRRLCSPNQVKSILFIQAIIHDNMRGVLLPRCSVHVGLMESIVLLSISQLLLFGFGLIDLRVSVLERLKKTNIKNHFTTAAQHHNVQQTQAFFFFPGEPSQRHFSAATKSARSDNTGLVLFDCV